MTEHVCKWEFVVPYYKGAEKVFIVCRDNKCKMVLTKEMTEARLNALEKSGALKEALIIALHLLAHADFKNGNTGPNGIIDEGEVYAGRLIDKIIKMLIPQLYADILEGK